MRQLTKVAILVSTIAKNHANDLQAHSINHLANSGKKVVSEPYVQCYEAPVTDLQPAEVGVTHQRVVVQEEREGNGGGRGIYRGLQGERVRAEHRQVGVRQVDVVEFRQGSEAVAVNVGNLALI